MKNEKTLVIDAQPVEIIETPNHAADVIAFIAAVGAAIAAGMTAFS